MEEYLEECLRKWTPPVGSQGVMEEALLSLLHDSDYNLDAARREHARLMEASIAGGTEHDDLILAKALQRREEVQPSGKKRKVAQKMKRKCLMLSHYEKLNDQCKPRTLRLPCPCIHQMI